MCSLGPNPIPTLTMSLELMIASITFLVITFLVSIGVFIAVPLRTKLNNSALKEAKKKVAELKPQLAAKKQQWKARGRYEAKNL